MPICVSELIIKVTLTDDLNAVGTGESANADSEISGQDVIVNACVEKVLEILEEKVER